MVCLKTLESELITKKCRTAKSLTTVLTATNPYKLSWFFLAVTVCVSYLALFAAREVANDAS